MRQFVLTLSLACITLFTGPVPIGHAQSDMDGGGMSGPSKRQSANPPRFAVVDLPIDEQMEELSPRQSARATVFHYELGSYKPTVQQGNEAGKSSIEIWAFETQPDEENGEGQIEVLVPLELAVHPNTVNKLSNGRIIMSYPGGMGMGGMGGMMGGMGMRMGGMGKSGGGMGGYGGGEMGGMGDGGVYGGEGGYGDAILVLNIGIGGMGGYGDMGGYGGEGGDMEGGMGMGGMGMGGMMGGTMQSTVRCYVSLATLAQAKQQTGAKLQLRPQEVEVVSSVIRQNITRRQLVEGLHVGGVRPDFVLIENITRRQLVEGLHRDLSDTVAVEKIEVRLKQLLAEEYDTQLKRQELEISEIEKRASELREELGRRKAAKERVVDVQLGRIILEAQGLLGK